MTGAFSGQRRCGRQLAHRKRRLPTKSPLPPLLHKTAFARESGEASSCDDIAHSLTGDDH